MGDDFNFSESKLARMMTGELSSAFGKASTKDFDRFADLDLGAAMEKVNIAKPGGFTT